MIIDKLKVKVRGGTPQEQFDIVDRKVKGWIGGIEGRTEIKRDEQIAFGLDTIERKGGVLHVTYSAIIEPKRLK